MEMNIKEKIGQIKDKAARVAVKAAAVATLMSGAGVVSSCQEQENNRDTDENGEKIEKMEGTKTSVVFRTKSSVGYKGGETNQVLLENGDVLHQEMFRIDIEDGAFLETGDTVTYNGNNVKAIRYKGGNGKQVNFGKIGKIGKDITD